MKTSLDVTAETQEIDVYFRPTSPEIPPELGLLGRLAQTPCLLEPYRNPVTIDGIIACLSKLFTVREQLQREAHGSSGFCVETGSILIVSSAK